VDGGLIGSNFEDICCTFLEPGSQPVWQREFTTVSREHFYHTRMAQVVSIFEDLENSKNEYGILNPRSINIGGIILRIAAKDVRE
jgi:hypothetical protein